MIESHFIQAAAGIMNPLVTSQEKYLNRYGYGLRYMATIAESKGKIQYADHLRARAYYLRTQVNVKKYGRV